MAIHVNQVGYYKNEAKTAVFTDGTAFFVKRVADDVVVKEGQLSEKRWDATSGDMAVVADFSELTMEGQFYLTNDVGERSVPFAVLDNLYGDLQREVLKAFYFQRCGCALTEQYAGVFKHAACHTSPVGELYSKVRNKLCNGGWHDAGDYGRYPTAAATALGHMLYAYLLFQEQWNVEVGIPESGNGVPDILNECRYELSWLLSMQTDDGGVYHKLTSWQHAGFVLPEEDTLDFYLFPVSSMATGDFAAIMALAARVYRPFDEAFANQMLAAAKRAWEWLVVHKEFTFPRNPEGCNTGGYYDRADVDERTWAAAELYVATGEAAYEEAMLSYAMQQENLTGLGWADMSGFAGLAVLSERATFSSRAVELFEKAYIAEANRLVQLAKESPYGLPIVAEEYTWGSNMTVLIKAMVLAIAAHLAVGKALTPNAARYHQTAISLLDYLLGKNALDVSYVTGFGEGAFEHPHNRPTVAMPGYKVMAGWVSGGANRGLQDVVAKEAIAEGTPPMRCYVDRWEAYSLNEIAIYWNSPLLFMTAYMQARLTND